MASKPLKPCRHPGCGTLTKDGWCPVHAPKRSGTRRESAAWHSWYSLSVWTDELRPAQLLREPFCRECARTGRKIRATDVDHIRDHKGDWASFVNEGNLESLCHSCHSRKTMREQWQDRRKRSRR